MKEVARATHADFIDLLGFVCPKAPACLEQIDGHVLCGDGVHFKDDRAQVVGEWLLSQLPAERTVAQGTVPDTTK